MKHRLRKSEKRRAGIKTTNASYVMKPRKKKWQEKGGK